MKQKGNVMTTTKKISAHDLQNLTSEDLPWKDDKDYDGPTKHAGFDIGRIHVSIIKKRNTYEMLCTNSVTDEILDPHRGGAVMDDKAFEGEDHFERGPEAYKKWEESLTNCESYQGPCHFNEFNQVMDALHSLAKNPLAKDLSEIIEQQKARNNIRTK